MFKPQQWDLRAFIHPTVKTRCGSAWKQKVAQRLCCEKVPLQLPLSPAPLPLALQITERLIVKFPARTRGFAAAAAAAASRHHASLPVFWKVTADATLSHSVFNRRKVPQASFARTNSFWQLCSSTTLTKSSCPINTSNRTQMQEVEKTMEMYMGGKQLMEGPFSVKHL